MTSPGDVASRAPVTVSAIYFYPLKGAAGLSCTRRDVETIGLAGDRRWAVCRPDGAFVSQRDEPRLGRVQATLGAEGLTLRAPERPALTVATPTEGAQTRIHVWGDDVPVLPAAGAAHAWLSAYLGSAVRLVYLADPQARPVERAYGRASDRVSLADEFPLLLTSEASLADLDARIGAGAAPLSMRRFRPNLVVSGGAPYAEDGWEAIRVGEVTFRLVKPCARCQVPTLDPETGAPGLEPLRTLARYRRRDGKVYFGWNAIPDRAGTIWIGAPVEVLRRRDPQAAGAFDAVG